MSQMIQRSGFVSTAMVALMAAPFVGALTTGLRALRVPVVHELVGVGLFGLVALSIWVASAAARASAAAGLGVWLAASWLLFAPFSLTLLLWVGLGTPWDATPPENLLRYVVLLISSVAVTSGLALMSVALHDLGERLFSTLACIAIVLAGSAYLVWSNDQIEMWVAIVRGANTAESPSVPRGGSDTLLFSACVLTYLGTASYAASFRRAHWLGARGCAAFTSLSLLAVVLILIRGLTFPDPTQGASPWYTEPGFIVGIPAVPWIMPHLLGVIALIRLHRYPGSVN